MMKSVLIIVAYIVLITCSLCCSMLIGTIAGWLWQNHKHAHKLTYRDLDVALVFEAGLFGLPFFFIILALSCWYLGYNNYSWLKPMLFVFALFGPAGFSSAKWIRNSWNSLCPWR